MNISGQQIAVDVGVAVSGRTSTSRFTKRRLGLIDFPAGGLPGGSDGSSREWGADGDDGLAEAGSFPELGGAVGWNEPHLLTHQEIRRATGLGIPLKGEVALLLLPECQ